MNQTTGIHCKVICQDQMRRFQFSGTEFSSLQHQVNQLLGLNREFVLKYKDNEGDMITISSTEELACAIDISQKENGGLFRLTVFLSEPSSTTGIPSQPFQFPTNPEFFHHRREFYCRGGGRGKWGHHGRFGGCPEDGPKFPCHFERPGWGFEGPASPEHHPWKGKRCHGGELPCKKRMEKRRNKMMFKRDMFTAYLSSLEQLKELSPEEERRKQMFQAKIQHIDSVLAHFSPETDQVNCEKPDFCPKKDVEPEFDFCPKYKKCQRKFEKKQKKCEKKEHKEGKKKENKELKNSQLSEEAKAEINTLKNQIKELKPALWAIQEQLKAKKAEAKKAFENGQNPVSFRGDIIKLKQEKRAIKDKIAPLRQRIHQLKACGGK